jgi:hypothetical protein
MNKRQIESGNGGGQRPNASEWMLADKRPHLLPAPWLDPYEFEDFVKRLLRAERYLGPDVRHVAWVQKYGSKGDRQEGIDLRGDYTDGTHAAWQCKHQERLRPFEVRDAVQEVTYEGAEELYLVYCGVAKQSALEEMDNHEGWTLLDRGDLTDMFRELPLQVQRDILNATWGEDVRRIFLKVPGDAFVSIESFATERKNADAVINDLGPMVGREEELTALESAFTRGTDGARQVVVVSGPAGRGKSRLVTDALTALQDRQPDVPVVCLSAKQRFEQSSMIELRMGPMVLLVDDAHNDPAALEPLLAFVRQRPDVQIVLATRPSATLDLIGRINEAGFGASEVAQVDVGILSMKHARHLVRTLTEDLDVRFQLQTYLADQAQHSPFVAVITANLMRRGELTRALGSDDGLRTHVLARFREVLGADVQGFSEETTQRVLATYTALGPTNYEDRSLIEQIARFCCLESVDLARLRTALLDRGVLVKHGGIIRVVPDALADHVLEEAAAHEDFDSGFVTDLWIEFGANHHHQLALSLGELDWRLAQRGGPRVMTNVWATIRDRFDSPYYGRIIDELGYLDQLAATQPAEVIALLEGLRARLDSEDADDAPVPEDPDDEPYRVLWGRPPRGRDDVRTEMPNLYARAAVNDPDQLETALDALWALRRRKNGPTNSNTDHPERMVSDYIANLGTLPHASFPARIVARVATWLEEPTEPDDVTTPLFALKPLLAKEGLETYQAGLRKLQFQPHTINATKVRDVRDQIREVLRTQALSTDLRRVGESLDLLTEALHQPHGYFGHSISTPTILQWEEDDLATLDVFEYVATATSEPAVRRSIRERVEWSAEHAASLLVRRAALTLAAQLDNMADIEDELADIVWHQRHDLDVTKGREVPTIEQLEAERTAERERLVGMTDEEKNADRNARIHEQVQRRMAREGDDTAAVGTKVLRSMDINAVVDLVDATSRAVLALKKSHPPNLWGLWRHVGQQAPGELEAIVESVTGRDAGPLDQDLPQLVTAWHEYDPDAATAWVQEAVTSGRYEVKRALAQGYSGYNWHEFGPPFDDIWTTGTKDADPDIAQAFLGAAGAYLRQSPQAATKALLDHQLTAFAAQRALADACNYDGRTFGGTLNRDDAESVLRLIDRAGFEDYAIQGIVTGIAANHPTLVLDHLAQATAVGVHIPDDIHELRAAYETHPDAFAGWIQKNLDSPHAGLIVSAAVNDHLTDGPAAAIAEFVPSVDAEQLEQLTRVLAPMHTWAIDRPDLAHVIATRARATGTFDHVRTRIRRAMGPHGWTYSNGVSSELNAALARATEAAEQADDPDLKADYEEASAELQAEIDEMKREHEEEQDEE